MKRIKMVGLTLACLVLVAVGSDGQAQSVRVKGYVKSSGTYVLPHYRTTPDSSRFNNWSTKGNINPYTGKTGTKSSFSFGSRSTSSWSLGSRKY